MIRRLLGIDGNCFADQVNRLGMTSLRMSNDTEQMQAVGMTWIDCQTLPVEPFGVLDAPALVVLQGGSEHSGNGGRLPRRLLRAALFAVHGTAAIAMTEGKLLAWLACRLDRVAARLRPLPR
jgi:hypothetical protein